METAAAVLLALAAACSFGVAAVVQQGVAATLADDELLRPRLIADLARHPVWVAGMALQVFSYALQASALAFGPLALVAPIAGLDLLFALPLVARRRHEVLTPVEWVGALCVGGGVAVFLAVSPPARGVLAPGLSSWVPVFAAVAGVVVVGGAVGRTRRGSVRGSVLAATGAIEFGLVAALSKSFVGLIRAHGFITTLGRWEPYALLAAGLVGTVLSQSAFQAGPLAVSLPVIDTLEPISGVAIGATLFHEHLAGSALPLLAQMTGAAVAVVGIVVLDRSPLVRGGPGRVSGGG